MKITPLILFIFFALGSTGQVKKFWLGDTVNVRCGYDTNTEVIPDTEAFTKSNDLVPKGDTVVLYWDKEMHHRYETYIQGAHKNNDTNYYRNGNIDRILYPGLRETDFYWKMLYPNGSKKEETLFKGNTRVVSYYYPDGKIRQEDISLKGIKDWDTTFYFWVYTKIFCENGTVIVQDSVNSLSVRKIVRYYCDKSKEAEFTLWRGHCLGSYRTWYPNGQPKINGQYADIIKAKEANNYNDIVWGKQGKWSYYDENGKLIKEENYRDGDLIETKTF